MPGPKIARSVTIVSIGSDVLDATYELDFAGGRVKGKIHASNCAAACGVLGGTCARR